MTYLRFASFRGYDALVDILIKEGADLNAKDSQRWTPLIHAIDGNQVARVTEKTFTRDFKKIFS
jgi:hypothetical protein